MPSEAHETIANMLRASNGILGAKGVPLDVQAVRQVPESLDAIEKLGAFLKRHL